mmetsp:Transcript_11488/g.24879  ORF Transcript_11488/g.24879 Transcript_11488/m.24879 type:complete len:327 (+) Transcript_11488:10-990(+)
MTFRFPQWCRTYCHSATDRSTPVVRHLGRCQKILAAFAMVACTIWLILQMTQSLSGVSTGCNSSAATGVVVGKPEAVQSHVSNSQSNFIAGVSTMSSYKDALSLLAKLKDVGSISHVLCNSSLEIGWRQPENLVPRHIGNRCEPWWVRDAIFLLEHIMRPDWKVLEWGAGSSTVWFSSHAGSVITIEDSEEWVHDLGVILETHGIHNVELRHRNKQANGTMHSSRGCCYDDYVTGASDLQDGSLDVVSVDGRARERCLKEAVRLVAPVGGILVLDNSVRKRYQETIEKIIPKTWLRHDATLLNNMTAMQDHWIKRDDIFTTFWITR